MSIFCLCGGVWGGQTGIRFPCVDVLWVCEPPDVGVNNWTWSSWRQLLTCLSSLLSLFCFLKVCTWMHVEVTGQLQVWALAFHHLLNHLLLSMSGFLALELLGNSSVSSSCCRNTGNICYHAWLYMGAGDPNSGPDDNLPCALPTEPFVQSYFCFQFILHAHEGTAWGSKFAPFTVWVLRIRLRSLGLEKVESSHWLFSLIKTVSYSS